MDKHDASDLRRTFAGLVDQQNLRPPRDIEARVARLIIEPGTEDEIAEVVRKCESDGLALAPIGSARTLSQIRREPVAVGLSLARMNRIIDYQADDMTVVAEAGLTLGGLSECAAAHGQRLPCDPPNPALTTLGALVGAAKSGPIRLSEGSPRDLLIGIRFAGHGARLIHGGGRVVKNVAGYDLMKVMTGSFGTLGIITETAFKLRPAPDNYSLAIASFDSPADAMAAAARAEQAAPLIHLEVVSPALGELFGRKGRSVILAGIGGSPTEKEHCRASVSNAVKRNTQVLTGADAIANYQRLRDIDLGGASLSAQLAVLPAELARCLDTCGAEFRAHAASGVAQIFLGADRAASEIRDAVIRWREVAHAAHGSLRVLGARDDSRAELEFFDRPPDGAILLMRRLKQAFDPKNVFNPGCFVGRI